MSSRQLGLTVPLTLLGAPTRALMFSECRQQMDHQAIAMRIVRSDEFDSALHQAANEMDAITDPDFEMRARAML
jgi:hypothetical protein